MLSGRGAFINGHVGNTNFRKLCLERKQAFDAGNYSEKRALATEVVQLTKALDPPGRFLKRVPKNMDGNRTLNRAKSSRESGSNCRMTSLFTRLVK